MKGRLVVLVALLALLPLAMVQSATAQTSRLDEVTKAGVVRVGVFTDLEPYGFLDPSPTLPS